MAVTGGTATPGSVVVATNVTGEAIWANPNTIGAIASNSFIYIYQSAAKVIATKGTDEWWPEGHIDILLKVQNAGTLIDAGEVTVLARQYTQLYSHSVVDLSAGARTPVALASGDDGNNDTGNRTVTGSVGSGTFLVGERLEVTATDKEAVITSVAGTTANPILGYYLIGSPQTDFVLSDALVGITSGASCTAGTPANLGPALLTGANEPSSSFTAITRDLNNGEGLQPYSIEIDVQYNSGAGANTIEEFYEWTKHANRRGETTITLDGQAGEIYTGSSLQLEYDNQSANFTEGLVVTGQTSGAFGTIVADHDDGATGDLILRNVRGTFQDNEVLNDSATGVADILLTGGIRTISTPPAAPLGTFAGGIFFGAPGVWLLDIPPSDAGDIQLTDDNGNTRLPPNSVSVEVTNLVSGDSVAVFRIPSAGAAVNKDEYSATVQPVGANTLVITGGPISLEAPAPGGKVRVVDTGTQVERRYRYSSFTASTFTLDSIEGNTADVGGSATTLIDASEDFVAAGVEVGDTIINVTESNTPAFITAVATTTLTMAPSGVTDWSSDAYEINTLGQAYDAADNVYVPFIDEVATTSTSSATVIQSTTIDVRVVVRRNIATAILPFETDNQILAGGMSQATIRTPDTITA
jgi:hypothetical protein